MKQKLADFMSWDEMRKQHYLAHARLLNAMALGDMSTAAIQWGQSEYWERLVRDHAPPNA